MSPKELLLTQLRPAIVAQLQAEAVEGKLDVSKRYDFEANFGRIYEAIHDNVVMATTLKAFKVSKDDLKSLVKECLTEVGVQL